MKKTNRKETKKCGRSKKQNVGTTISDIIRIVAISVPVAIEAMMVGTAVNIGIASAMASGGGGGGELVLWELLRVRT